MIRRTVVVKLAVPDDRRDDLKRTTERFRQAAQLVVDRAFERDDDGNVITTKQRLHELTYQQVREATDGLNADLVCAARNHAADAVQGVVTAWSDGRKASKPTFTAPTVVYNQNACTSHEESVSLATVNGRVECDYILPPEGGNPQTEYLRSDEWELRESTLHYRDGDYYLHVGVAKDDEPQGAVEGGTVLGVDLNVDGYVAVTSTGASSSRPTTSITFASSTREREPGSSRPGRRVLTGRWDASVLGLPAGPTTCSTVSPTTSWPRRPNTIVR